MVFHDKLLKIGLILRLDSPNPFSYPANLPHLCFMKHKHKLKIKNMKTIKMTKMLLTVLVVASSITACKKKEGCMDPTAINYDPDAKKNCCCEYAPPPASDIADKIAGNCIGVVIFPGGGMVYNKIMKVSKVNSTRVRIESVDHNYIDAFEINIMEDGMEITGDEDINEDNSIRVQTDSSPYKIDLARFNPARGFSGTKQ